MTAFADRLIEGVRSKGTPLCIGLDPFPDKIPAVFGPTGSVLALQAFSENLIAIAAQHAAVLKPQLGFFEAYGPDGFAVAVDAVARAKLAGMAVILDAKRGDIGSTAEGYTRACLGPAPGFDADCVTINPYLGKDSLEPFIAEAQAREKGVAVLVRTSNPGARDLQDLNVDGAPLWHRVAEMIEPAAPRLVGASGWSGLMAVAGATYPQEARALRALMPRSLLLVPGYGAQGASAADAAAGFVTGKYGREGGVISSSRAVAYPPAAQAAKTLENWRAAISDAMSTAAAELRAACIS
ncbi:orotidine-5'-phosphate decarboxylase [Terricaulis sp.]|uniref:orotidine-5'-phosphate decarboxylase n=1 Tax=Terricaulis sp. TaxID=2768686 RepID=UPI003783A8F3